MCTSIWLKFGTHIGGLNSLKASTSIKFGGKSDQHSRSLSDFTDQTSVTPTGQNRFEEQAEK